MHALPLMSTATASAACNAAAELLAGASQLHAAHVAAAVVLHKPLHTLPHGLLKGRELEVWQVLAQLGVGRCLLVLAVSLAGVKVDVTLRDTPTCGRSRCNMMSHHLARRSTDKTAHNAFVLLQC
jgi:hypothetical protein